MSILHKNIYMYICMYIYIYAVRCAPGKYFLHQDNTSNLCSLYIPKVGRIDNKKTDVLPKAICRFSVIPIQDSVLCYTEAFQLHMVPLVMF